MGPLAKDGVTHMIMPKLLKAWSPTAQSAFKSGATVSARLIPGETLTETMFDFWAFELTTGTAVDPSSVFGACAWGNASRIRWRWREKMMDRRDRVPSAGKIEFSGTSLLRRDDGSVAPDFSGARVYVVNAGEKYGRAAAAAA